MNQTLVIASRELRAYFANPRGHRVHRHLPGLARGADVQPRSVLRPRPGRPEFVLHVHSLGFPAADPCHHHAPLAEERRLGTIELLLTLPITQGQAVLGKFLAAWTFCAIALLLTFPFVIAVNILGSPDNGVIASGYVGCLLVAGAFLSVGAAMSAVTRNQVIAFVLAVAICFMFAVASNPIVNDFLAHNVPVLGEFSRRIAVIERFYQLYPRRHRAARPDLFCDVHRLLPIPQYRAGRSAEGGLIRCAKI